VDALEEVAVDKDLVEGHSSSEGYATDLLKELKLMLMVVSLQFLEVGVVCVCFSAPDKIMSLTEVGVWFALHNLIFSLAG